MQQAKVPVYTSRCSDGVFEGSLNLEINCVFRARRWKLRRNCCHRGRKLISGFTAVEKIGVATIYFML